MVNAGKHGQPWGELQPLRRALCDGSQQYLWPYLQPHQDLTWVRAWVQAYNGGREHIEQATRAGRGGAERHIAG